MRKTLVLLILDGWGIGSHDQANPIFSTKLPTIEHIKTNYLSGSLQSSGIAVGLPWGEEGNSEVGHLTIGAGKVVYQHFPRITMSIENGDFFKNPALVDAFKHARTHTSAVNLVGLLTEGNVHASLEHIRALMAASKEHGVPKLNLHLFADGKDSKPRSVMALLKKIQEFIDAYGIGAIASVSGRFYALDRDEQWDRTKQTYDVLTGTGTPIEDIEAKVNTYYTKGLNDPFIEPFIVGPEIHPIQNNDAVVFFDFREDSIRQIASPFAKEGFDAFPIKPIQNLYVTTMTKYTDDFNVPVISQSDTIPVPLGKVIADNELLQLRVAETEKHAHVTYFFNGYHRDPFQNEYRVIIPSKKVASNAENPKMRTGEIATRIIEGITDGGFDFILANFAASDMVAHTGDYHATVEAITVIDKELKNIVDACIAKDAMLAITADHGNAERVMDPLTGYPETKHNPNLVPFYLIGKEFTRKKTQAQVAAIESEATGILSDVAPTILELLSIAKPDEMTGKSLLHRLK